MVSRIQHVITQCSLCAVSLLILFTGLVQTGRCYGQDTTQLRVIRNVPIVRGTINGLVAYFLVDTGSTVTVLNESLQSHYGFSVVKNRFWDRRCVVGMGGRCSLKEAQDVTVGLGSISLAFVNKASDLTMLSEQFVANDIVIAGIIGTDLLCFLGSKIDLRERTIVFKP